ncbi:MAG: UbiX family flavin prenyltransferase [bacterium]
MRIVLGITGSSGAIFAREFLRRSPAENYLVVSKWGKVLLKDELQISTKDLATYIKKEFSDDDLTAPIASGSNRIDAFVILPCSSSTLGKIASGIGDTLITRTAQVALKERHKMILCLRETPMSTVSLEQAARLSRDGVIIMPITPSLYFVPKSVEEYVQDFVDRVLAAAGVKESRGWRAEELE